MSYKPGLTLADIENMNSATVTIDEVAPVINCDPQTIRTQAHEDPSKLGFPVIITGRYIKIPRIAFIKYMYGELASENLSRQIDRFEQRLSNLVTKLEA